MMERIQVSLLLIALLLCSGMTEKIEKPKKTVLAQSSKINPSLQFEEQRGEEDLCNPPNGFERVVPPKHRRCTTGELNSDVVCLHGFPDSVESTVLKLTVKDANLAMLGHRKNGESTAFVSSSSLRILVLSNLSISSTCPNVFQRVPNLKVLDLSHNMLTSLGDTIFQHLTYLEELDVSYNSITVVTKNAFTMLRSLKKLYLSFNKLNQFDAGLPQSLLNLNLANNELYALSDSFALPSLETLDLCHNPLHDFGTKLKLPTLKKLCITDSSKGEALLKSLQAPIVKQLTLAAEEVEIGVREPHPTYSVQACDSLTQFTAVEQLTVMRHSLAHVNFFAHLMSCHNITLQWVTVTQPLTPHCFANAINLDLSHSKQLAYEVVTRVEVVTSMTLLQTINLQHCDLLTLQWFTYFTHLHHFVSCDISYNDKVCTDVDTLCQEVSKGANSKLVGIDTLHCGSSEVIFEEEPQRTIDTPSFCLTTKVDETSETTTHHYNLERTAAPQVEKPSYVGLIVGLILGILLLLLLIGLTVYYCKAKSSRREAERLVKK